jgi:hypothetical protein
LILKVVKKDSLRLFANVSKNTSIDIKDVTVDCIGSMGCKEYSGATELLWIEPTSGWSLGTDEAVEGVTAAIGLTLAERCGLWSCDVTWANAVALDIVLAVL